MMLWIIRFFFRRKAVRDFLFFLMMPAYVFSADKNLKDLRARAKSEFFFTQIESCYELEIIGSEPRKVQVEIPELFPGVRFISSKKEEFFSESRKKGTRISLWFTFSDSGEHRLPPLLVKISGKSHYIEFEPVFVYENPDTISPSLEVIFAGAGNSGMKDGKKTLIFHQGEKITFTVAARYAAQILNFKWNLPKDSIFRETERFEFAKGSEKIVRFTTERKNLAAFEWQILKEGIYPLPEIIAEAEAYNGSRKRLSLPDNIQIMIEEKAHAEKNQMRQEKSPFELAFEETDTNSAEPEARILSKEECAGLAEKEKLSFLDRILSRKFGIFAGGEISSVPENGLGRQNFGGGQKVKISEKAGEWIFIECDEFSGWTKSENVREIK